MNIGAGTGNYEPDDRFVVAVDPSLTMLHQRAAGAAPASQACAEALPFADGAFDVALATLTVHHWDDIDRGLREMQRVARRQVIFFFEPSFAGALLARVASTSRSWRRLGTERGAPGLEHLQALLPVTHVEPLPVPADCCDGFAGCYWNRPEAYLDPVVQAGMSSLAQLDPEIRRAAPSACGATSRPVPGMPGTGTSRDLAEIDIGYRLAVAGPLS